MLISEFAQETGLSTDTVRFYVRKGLLSPETGNKGGSNPYQIFSPALVETARVIRLGQSLGFSLKEIAAFGAEYRAGALTPARGADILRGQLGKLEEKAAQLAGMIGYVRAKIAWLEGGGQGAEPRFGVFACGVTEGVAAAKVMRGGRLDSCHSSEPCCRASRDAVVEVACGYRDEAP